MLLVQESMAELDCLVDNFVRRSRNIVALGSDIGMLMEIGKSGS
jgi:hypothetical protein